MEYRLLGQLEVIGDDGQQVAFAGDKERVALAVLLLVANRVVSTSRLVDALCGERPPAGAANALQVQMSRLRKKLAAAADGRDLLRGDRSGYRLEVEPGELDVERFETLASSAGGSPSEVSARLGEALGLSRGLALGGVDGDALRSDAVRLDELRWTALERRIDADLALGRHQRLVGELEVLVAEHPLPEGFARQLMIASYRCDRQADALASLRPGGAAQGLSAVGGERG
jgi:DNA-binding SARP family transcriptional activator